MEIARALATRPRSCCSTSPRPARTRRSRTSSAQLIAGAPQRPRVGDPRRRARPAPDHAARRQDRRAQRGPPASPRAAPGKSAPTPQSGRRTWAGGRSRDWGRRRATDPRSGRGRRHRRPNPRPTASRACAGEWSRTQRRNDERTEGTRDGRRGDARRRRVRRRWGRQRRTTRSATTRPRRAGSPTRTSPPPRASRWRSTRSTPRAGSTASGRSTLTLQDNRSEAAQSAVVAQDLISKGVKFLICTSDADPCTAAGQIAQKAGIPTMSTAATSPTLPGSVGDFMFMSVFGDNTQTTALADYAVEQGYKNAYLLCSPDSSYTSKSCDYFGQVFEKKGGAIAGRGSFTLGAADFSAEVTKIKNLSPQPDVIMTPGVPAGRTDVHQAAPRCWRGDPGHLDRRRRLGRHHQRRRAGRRGPRLHVARLPGRGDGDGGVLEGVQDEVRLADPRASSRPPGTTWSRSSRQA